MRAKEPGVIAIHRLAPQVVPVDVRAPPPSRSVPR